uniref:Uncharacterized protein n=1 Tax=Arundo donax TaxID=35708 RepID=A0A0A9QS71_ARUDO
MIVHLKLRCIIHDHTITP